MEDRDLAKGVEFWQGEAFWNEGIPMGCSQRTRVGTSILLDKIVVPFIVDHGTLDAGRAQFITLQPPSEGALTIINVYAPNLSTDRAQLCQKVSQANLIADHFILGGDLNHQEPSEANNSSGTRQLSRRETSAWHHMTLKYGLSDAWKLDNFHKLTKKAFTFDNGRQGSSSTLSRINKFLVSQSVEERGGRIVASASVRKLTDHSPFTISIWGTHQTEHGNRPCYFDLSIRGKERGRKELWEVWTGDHPPPLTPSQSFNWPAWLEAATDRVMRCNGRLLKEKKRAQGACIKTCSKKIQLVEVQLQADPTNAEVRDILSDAQEKLEDVFQSSVERTSLFQHLSSSSWLRYGDTCSKAFFDFHRIGKKKTLLRELETEEGIIGGQSDLTLYVSGFYAKLYTSDATTLGIREAQEECWKSVPVKVSPAMNERLIQDLSLKDSTEAIRVLPKGRAPGHDGIPMEFFQEFEAEIAPTLVHACSAMLRTGATSPFINKGIISLIPKSGDRAKLNNWRPITLLGSLYKILAKTLASRLRMELTEIIRSNQTGFVEGRSIQDNVFMAQEGLGWAEESNQDLVLLLLDFEKAFDRIEWGFLFRAVEQLGFSQTWVHWVTSLY